MTENLIILSAVGPSYNSDPMDAQHNVSFYGKGMPFNQDVTLDEIESLELQLTNIVAQLYAYRKEHEDD